MVFMKVSSIEGKLIWEDNTASEKISRRCAIKMLLRITPKNYLLRLKNDNEKNHQPL